MARIRTYALDNNVTGSDYWIGTDGNDNSNTKNFSPNSVAQYLNENEIIDVSNSVRFRYDTIDSGQQRKDGTISFQNEIGATVPMNQLSSFILSKKTQSGKDVSFFLNVLPTTKVILHKADDINLFGLYKVLSVITDILEPNFFNVSLEFISGHGSIEEDKDYIISLIDLNKTIPVLQLTKETFNYVSSSSFTLSNTIGNILQVIINATSLHPEGYSYTLPSTVTILNELYVGDVVTIVYNYLEEFFEVPDLQRVTNVGNHTTNDIIIDGIQGVYTTTNTITDEGSFNSATSVGSYQYQSEYLVDGMSINEISTSNQNKSSYITPGFISSTLTHPVGFNAANISVGTSTTSPSFNLSTELGSGRILIDNLTSPVYLQFPNKPLGTYTIATTDDVSPNYWANTGDDIQNNNIGNTKVKLLSGKQFQLLNSANTIVGYIDETGIGKFGAGSTYTSFGPASANIHLNMVRTQMSANFTLGNPAISQPYSLISTNYFGTSYVAGSAEVSASAVAEHSFNIGNSVGNGITSGIFRISRTRVQSTVPVKYATDLSASYDDRTLVDKGYVNNRLVVETASPYTLTNADSGGIVIFTASTTLTIPTGLADGFECTFVTLSGVTLTVVSTGNTLNNATSTTMLPQLSFTLKRMLAANTYITAGSL